MKRFTKLFAVTSIAFIFALALNLNVNAQLSSYYVNEVEIDPPNPTVLRDACQYAELRGPANASIPANTYFISINSDNSNPGFLNVAVDLGGRSFGSNGLLVILNTLQNPCPNRTYGDAAIVNYTALTTFGQTSEGFYIVTSATPLQSGTDADRNDDGIVDNPITYGDGFNIIFNPEEQFAYGPGANLVEILLSLDTPDAVTRFDGNNTPNVASAFYSGQLASSPEETTTYIDPRSANFPTGGMLTPGARNTPFGGTPNAAPTKFDYDDDGKADLSVFRPSEGIWYLNRSTTGFGAVRFGIATDVIVPGDYDGDGRTDIAIFRASDNPGTPDFYFLTNDGLNFSGAPFGSTGDIPAIADYDGDGKDDIAIYRPSNNYFYILNSSNGNVRFALAPANGSPVPADYDGDQKADVAVYNNGIYTIMLSNGGGQVTYTVGQAGDIATPADFDGDNIDDPAVFRPIANGTWYVRQSTTQTVVPTRWGTTGDIPVAADYDGDGRADFATYRGRGQWWILQSTAGQVVRQFGVETDRPTPAAYNR